MTTLPTAGSQTNQSRCCVTPELSAVGIVAQGEAIARYGASGTNIEYGWATLSGQTLARQTTGYTEVQVTPAGQSMRPWLNRLGAHAGSS